MSVPARFLAWLHLQLVLERIVQEECGVSMVLQPGAAVSLAEYALAGMWAHDRLRDGLVWRAMLVRVLYPPPVLPKYSVALKGVQQQALGCMAGYGMGWRGRLPCRCGLCMLCFPKCLRSCFVHAIVRTRLLVGWTDRTDKAGLPGVTHSCHSLSTLFDGDKSEARGVFAMLASLYLPGLSSRTYGERPSESDAP
eukprot:scaffold141030_cov23-Tisochrysis_lutea.AAC.3